MNQNFSLVLQSLATDALKKVAKLLPPISHEIYRHENNFYVSIFILLTLYLATASGV